MCVLKQIPSCHLSWMGGLGKSIFVPLLPKVVYTFEILVGGEGGSGKGRKREGREGLQMGQGCMQGLLPAAWKQEGKGCGPVYLGTRRSGKGRSFASGKMSNVGRAKD